MFFSNQYFHFLLSVSLFIMSQVGKYHQPKLNKKYLRAINDDPKQRKLVFHDISYQGQHYRNLSATGFNPIFQPPQVVQNYGPVFGNIGSVAAPMVFGGNYKVCYNSHNRSIPQAVSNGKESLSSKSSKRSLRQENEDRLAALFGMGSTGKEDGIDVKSMAKQISIKKEPECRVTFLEEEKQSFLKSIKLLRNEGFDSDYKAAEYIVKLGGNSSPSLTSLLNWIKEDAETQNNGGIKVDNDGRKVNHEFEKQVSK